jgi:hypothetical protein
MAIAIKSLTTAANNSGTSTIAVTTSESPSATSSGDLVVVFLANDYYTLATLGTPTVTGSPTVNSVTGTGLDVDAGTNNGHQRAFWYVANTGGAQTITSTFSGAHDEEREITAIVLSGADTASPVDSAAGSFATVDETSFTCPAVSPSQTNSYVITHYAGGGDNTFTPPGSITEQAEWRIVGAFSGATNTAQLSASGSTGTYTFTVDGGNHTGGRTSITIAVKTASSTAAGVAPQAMPPRAPWGGPSPRGAVPPQFMGDRAAIIGYLSDGTTVSTTTTITAAGSATGQASLTVTETPSAAAVAGFGGSASLTVTETGTAVGDATGQASLTVTETITATGNNSSAGAATVTVTDTITAAGDATGQATLAETAAITAAGSLGVINYDGQAALTVTEAVSVSGLSSSQPDPNQVGIKVAPMFLNLRNSDYRFAGDAAPPSGVFTGTAALSVTATSTSAGQPTGQVALTVTEAITAVGQTTGAASLTVTASLASGGSLPGSSGAALSLTAAITAAGLVATSSGATLTITATPTAIADGTGQAARSTTAAITTTGKPMGDVAHAITAPITAVGTIATASGAALTITEALTAVGSSPAAGMPGNLHGPPTTGLPGAIS